jgi:sugar lactone lactonase YvrE
VLDSGNFRVQAFSPDGEFLFSFGQAGRTPGFFSHPKSIAIDREGKIYVSDTFFANIQIFDEHGRILMFMGDRSDRGGPGEFILPAGVSVDADGRVYMVDQFFRKVEVFRPAGVPESGNN